MTMREPELQLGPLLSTHQFAVRWGEMDALGHVNNAEYLRYFEDSRTVWAESQGFHLDGKGEGMIVLKAGVTYQKQLSYPARINVALHAGAVGRSSFHLVNILTIAGDSTPAAVGEFVIVWFDYVAGKSTAIPATLRAALAGKRAAT